MNRMQWRALGLLGLWLTACDGGGAGFEEQETLVEVLEPELPALVTACDQCHDLAGLSLSPGGEGLTPRDWLATAGLGMLRDDPAIPAADTRYSLDWPRRGYHPAEPGECAACHPLNAGGVGHGLSTYPDPGTAFQAGHDCATGCHGWQGQSPAGLLQAADNSHSRLWREGARFPQGQGHVAAFRPGCGGCHNLQAEAHGTITTCLQCHVLGGLEGELHQAHVAIIDADQEALDPEAYAAGVSACGYCHPEDDAPLERWRAACYTCHGSGHRPVEADGRPLSWR